MAPSVLIAAALLAGTTVISNDALAVRRENWHSNCLGYGSRLALLCGGGGRKDDSLKKDTAEGSEGPEYGGTSQSDCEQFKDCEQQ